MFLKGRPSNGNIWHPLARSNHAPDDQQPSAVVSAAIFEFRTQHHRLHNSHPPGDDSTDCATNTPDEEDAEHSAEAQGDSGKVQRQEGRRPSPDVF